MHRILKPLEKNIGVRISTANIDQFVNTIPCDAEDLYRPTAV